MGVPTRQKWMAFSLLAVVLPVSLLATLRLTGILPEPTQPETIIAESVKWEMERPQKYADIKDIVKNAYSNDTVSITVRISIHDYHENGLRDPYWGRDGIGFRVGVNATTIKGFITSIMVKFLPLDVNATLYTGAFLRNYNTTITYVKQIGMKMNIAYVEAKVTSSPCSLQIPAEWVFDDQNTENHHLRVDVAVTYSNEMTYRTAVIPIILDVLCTTT